MTLKRLVARIPFLRPACIRLLNMTKRNITIKNPWTNDSLHLNSFHHKGYWFYGVEREQETMELFKNYVSEGQTVLELGGHIGFISQYFSHLVGDQGKVIVFEPGRNNLPYIKRNTVKQQNVKIEEVAVSDQVGSAVFYEDNISGQNNSLLPEYKQANTVAASQSIALTKKENVVDVTTIDHYVSTHNLNVDFMKIDIEGNEYNALLGAKETLRSVKSLMVEVTENHDRISDLLRSLGFYLHDVHGKALPTKLSNGNVFAMKA